MLSPSAPSGPSTVYACLQRMVVGFPRVEVALLPVSGFLLFVLWVGVSSPAKHVLSHAFLILVQESEAIHILHTEILQLP